MAAAQILCTKCGAASAEPLLECAKCGGRNARVCGGCGNQNSIAKNFCDKCGQSIAQLGAIAPPPRTQPPGQPAADIPATAVKRLPLPGAAAAGSAAPPPAAKPASSASVPLPPLSALPPRAAPPPAASASASLPPLADLPAPPESAPLPLAGKSVGGPASAQLDDLWSAPPPAPPAEPASAPLAVAGRRSLRALAALAGILGAAYAIWTWNEGRKPEILVPKLAVQYLEALRTRDYPKAYEMFSEAARRSCTEDEFRASRDDTAWTWSDLRLEFQEPGAILFAYDLKAAGAPPRVDRLLFTLEATPNGNRWTRPYNWTLMRQVEAAFDKGDADKGLILAQSAATINPRDPMAWGYLCEAAYYRKSPADAAMRCEKALQLARTYPSNLTPKSLYHLHAILADTYLHALGRPALALEQYAEMLSFPGISPADQCSILLARAQAYVDISRPGEALSDLDRGAQLCAAPQDQAFIQKLRVTLQAPDAQ